MTLLTLSAVVHKYTSTLDTGFQTDSFVFTLFGGFAAMRIFKTSMNFLLDNRMGKVTKVLGNVIMLGGLVGGNAGALLGSAA